MDPFNVKLNSVIYANRGLVYSKMRKNDDAIKDFTKSIELNPHYYKAYHRRGDVYNTNSDFDSAEMDYRKVMEMEPSQG
jgi:Tfp pilus assembly protein PilF